MKEHPILYSTAMVKAKLEGRKTQTRRIIKPQPDEECYYTLQTEERNGSFGVVYDYNAGDDNPFVKCPYGKPRDLLWGRETFLRETDGVTWATVYKADCHDYPLGSSSWKPSIFMPKELARIWDEVVSIRVERLQDITEEDAIAEGLHVANFTGFGDEPHLPHVPEPNVYRASAKFEWEESPIVAYKELWESINGPGSWDLNPLVWRVETKPFSKDNE